MKCKNCGRLKEEHIDYFNTGKKDVCPDRRAMKFALDNNEVQNG